MDDGGSFLDLASVRIAIVAAGPMSDARFAELSAQIAALDQLPASALPKPQGSPRRAVSAMTSSALPPVSGSATYSGIPADLRSRAAAALATSPAPTFTRSRSLTVHTSPARRTHSLSPPRAASRPRDAGTAGATADDAPKRSGGSQVKGSGGSDVRPAMATPLRRWPDSDSSDAEASIRLRYVVVRAPLATRAGDPPSSSPASGGAQSFRMPSEWDSFLARRVWGVIGLVDCSDPSGAAANPEARDAIIAAARSRFSSTLSRFRSGTVSRLVVFTTPDVVQERGAFVTLLSADSASGGHADSARGATSEEEHDERRHDLSPAASLDGSSPDAISLDVDGEQGSVSDVTSTASIPQSRARKSSPRVSFEQSLPIASPFGPSKQLGLRSRNAGGAGSLKPGPSVASALYRNSITSFDDEHAARPVSVGYIPVGSSAEETRLEIRAQIVHFAGLLLASLESWMSHESVATELFLSPIDERTAGDKQSKLAKRRQGRLEMIQGFYFLQIGSSSDALNKFNSAIERSRANSDSLWLAGSMEGAAAAQVYTHVASGGRVDDTSLVTSIIEQYGDVYKLYHKKRVSELEAGSALRLAEFLGRWTSRRREALDAIEHAATVGESLRAVKKQALWEEIAKFCEEIGCFRKASLFLYRLGLLDASQDAWGRAATLMTSSAAQFCKSASGGAWPDLRRRVLLEAANAARLAGDPSGAAKLSVEALALSPEILKTTGDADSSVVRSLLNSAYVPTWLAHADRLLSLTELSAQQMRSLVVRERQEDSPQMDGSSRSVSPGGPFIYNPFAVRAAAAERAEANKAVTWVCGETAHISLTLQNNLETRLYVEIIAVSIAESGNEACVWPSDGLNGVADCKKEVPTAHDDVSAGNNVQSTGAFEAALKPSENVEVADAHESHIASDVGDGGGRRAKSDGEKQSAVSAGGDAEGTHDLRSSGPGGKYSDADAAPADGETLQSRLGRCTDRKTHRMRSLMRAIGRVATTVAQTVEVAPRKNGRDGVSAFTVSVIPRRMGAMHVCGLVARLFSGAIVLLSVPDVERDGGRAPPIHVMSRLPKLDVALQADPGNFSDIPLVQHSMELYEGENRVFRVWIMNNGSDRIANAVIKTQTNNKERLRLFPDERERPAEFVVPYLGRGDFYHFDVPVYATRRLATSGFLGLEQAPPGPSQSFCIFVDVEYTGEQCNTHFRTTSSVLNVCISPAVVLECLSHVRFTVPDALERDSVSSDVGNDGRQLWISDGLANGLTTSRSMNGDGSEVHADRKATKAGLCSHSSAMPALLGVSQAVVVDVGARAPVPVRVTLVGTKATGGRTGQPDDVSKCTPAWEEYQSCVVESGACSRVLAPLPCASVGEPEEHGDVALRKNGGEGIRVGFALKWYIPSLGRSGVVAVDSSELRKLLVDAILLGSHNPSTRLTRKAVSDFRRTSVAVRVFVGQIMGFGLHAKDAGSSSLERVEGPLTTRRYYGVSIEILNSGSRRLPDEATFDVLVCQRDGRGGSVPVSFGVLIGAHEGVGCGALEPGGVLQHRLQLRLSSAGMFDVVAKVYEHEPRVRTMGLDEFLIPFASESNQAQSPLRVSFHPSVLESPIASPSSTNVDKSASQLVETHALRIDRTPSPPTPLTPRTALRRVGLNRRRRAGGRSDRNAASQPSSSANDELGCVPPTSVPVTIKGGPDESCTNRPGAPIASGYLTVEAVNDIRWSSGPLRDLQGSRSDGIDSTSAVVGAVSSMPDHHSPDTIVH